VANQVGQTCLVNFPFNTWSRAVVGITYSVKVPDTTGTKQNQDSVHDSTAKHTVVSPSSTIYVTLFTPSGFLRGFFIQQRAFQTTGTAIAPLQTKR
jgi:hypothetical protein